MVRQQVARRRSMKILDILGEDDAASDERGDLGQAFVAAVDPRRVDASRWKSPFGRRDVIDSRAAEEVAAERSNRDAETTLL